MRLVTKNQLLFLVLFLEGYVVLACELLAIRELVPFVGSGTEVVSIVISAVLLPLAAGYHWGGKAYSRHHRRAGRRGRAVPSVRHLLARNFLLAFVILAVGLTYTFMDVFFTLLDDWGIRHRLPQTTIYSLLFLVIPVFLLGQTVPLISNYFSRKKLSEITGKMLFFSTAGSFLGSVFSTLVLMMVIGVHYTVFATLALLAALILLLVRRQPVFQGVTVFAVLLLWFANNQAAIESLRIVSNNAYNTIAVDTIGDMKLFSVNRSPSSILNDEGKSFGYVDYLESLIIGSKTSPTPRDILIIGAGGFTLGLHDTYNNYTYVDIDPDIKKAAEDHFLPGKLGENKTFVAASARAFVHNSDKSYDLILIDVYTNRYSVPLEATTREFLLDAKKRVKKNGVLVLHTGTSPAFEDMFTVRYHNTFASVFPVFTRQVMGSYEIWPDGSRPVQMNIVLYMYFNRETTEDRGVYTDDKNTYSLDRP
jgi:MFS family permease